MAAMISALTSSRAAAVLLCGVVAAAGVAACGRTIGGTAVQGSGPSTESALASVPLLALLLDTSAFPAEYPASHVESAKVNGALAVVDGVPEGARVSPPDCTPETPGEVAAVQGARDTTELLVVLARGAGPLSVRRDQVTRCSSYSVSEDDGGSWDVSVQMLPPPVLNVDDAFAFERTQTGRWFFDSVTLVGQIGPVGVTAQMTGLPGDQLDTTALDAVFTAQVQALRRAA
jgi:hypothetical protein